MDTFHTPVLLQEVIEGLDIRPGKKYIDATLGGGGHGLEIVKQGGIVLGIDVDKEAIEHVKKILSDKDIRILSEKKDQAHNILISQYPNITLVKGNFEDIGVIARITGFSRVSGILFDLGVSLYQLKAGERGFSFQTDGPLDMRMDPSEGGAAATDLVNGLYEHELVALFKKYGEEHNARPIARAICRAREVKKIETTSELAKIVATTKRGRGKIHPATQVFQALRIAVNDELESLEQALPQAVELLEEGGRIAAISFHSLEDRIVKQFFKKRTEIEVITKKPIIPSDGEVRQNPRARSAKLRIYEKNST